MTSRRKFLRFLGLGAGAAVAGPVVAKAVVEPHAAPTISTAGLSAIDANIGERMVGPVFEINDDGTVIRDASGRTIMRSASKRESA